MQGDVCWLWWCGGGEVGSVVLQAEVWWREVHGWPLQVQRLRGYPAELPHLATRSHFPAVPS